MATASWKNNPKADVALVRTDGGSPCRPRMRELVRAEGWDVYHYPALLKGLYEASAYSFLHRAEKGPWKASAHTDRPCSMARRLGFYNRSSGEV